MVTACSPRARNSSTTSPSNSTGSIASRSGSSPSPCETTPEPTCSGTSTGRTATRWSGRADNRPAKGPVRQSTALTAAKHKCPGSV